MRTKTYVKVTAIFDDIGNIFPKKIEWEDGTNYEVDKIIDIRPCASTKCGGFGIRYTCGIRGKEAFLFFEDNRWFVERKD
ncbi:MAG: hypothetical protein IKV97_03270 [Clostridia bacterium]|nr:hypothetical protein [Clostridia bacterium]